ncbi:MAG: hypothetical protein DBX38_02675 [Eubacteriales Family XIII. Incertae Sedis bacterium]|nr:MAG: hypothetical protein DBX38_02675 [Clostridiales Family XIII bacterium]
MTMAKVSCVRSGGPKLCSVCGPNVNTEDVLFSAREANLVYMDKVYSYNKATACPILHAIAPDTDWTTELVLESVKDDCDCDCGCGNGCSGNSGCGCGCGGRSSRRGCCCCNCDSGCTLTSEAVFNITRSYVLVQSLALEDDTLTEDNVTVDGVAVDTLTKVGNKYTATTDNLVNETGRERCRELGLPSKHFFLITGAGPWQLTAVIVLEGTVNTAGRTCCFQAKFRTTTPITVDDTSTLAIPKLALPCSVNGVSPTINFSFGGIVYVLNPTITATCTDDNCTLALSGSLAVQPQVNAEVVRRTLFCVDACEGMLPCDGTEAAYELDTDDDCTWPPAPACRCGTAPTPSNDPDICDTSIVCDFDNDNRPCNCVGGEQDERPRPPRPGGNGGVQWNGCNGCSGW